jgi:hypothetical protein
MLRDHHQLVAQAGSSAVNSPNQPRTTRYVQRSVTGVTITRTVPVLGEEKATKLGQNGIWIEGNSSYIGAFFPSREWNVKNQRRGTSFNNPNSLTKTKRDRKLTKNSMDNLLLTF